MGWTPKTLRTNQIVGRATLYYKTAASTDWERLQEAYELKIENHLAALTLASNVENVVFDGGIQIEQAAARYNKSYKAMKTRPQTISEWRWRTRFERGQYSNVFVKESSLPNQDPTKPALTFIEVHFDVDALPSGSDVSNVLSSPSAQATEAPPTERPFAFLVQKPATDEAEEEEEDLDLEEEEEDGQASKLPLVQLSDNDEKPSLTSIRLVFMRPKALKGIKQWSWPAAVRFLQGYPSCDKPDTLILETWKNILAYTLDGFARSGVNHSGMVAEGDGYRIPPVNQDDAALGSYQKPSCSNNMEIDRGSVQTAAGVEDAAKFVGKVKVGTEDKRAADGKAEGERDPKKRKGHSREKLHREYRELTWEEEWLEKDMAAKRRRLDQIREAKSKNRRELDRL